MAEEFLDKAGTQWFMNQTKAGLSEIKTASDALDARVSANETAIGTLVDELARVVNDAPEDFDSLKGIFDWISAHSEDTAAMNAQVQANTGEIDTLNGEGAGSVKKTVADEIAKVVADAPEDFDTLKEISDWISAHPEDTAAMNAQIQANTGAIETLNGSDTTAGSVAKQVKDAVSDKQTKDLSAPITVDENEQTTVEGALGALNEYIDDVAQATEATAGAVGALQTTVGDSNSGLVKEVSDNATAISALQTAADDIASVTEALGASVANLQKVTPLVATINDANLGIPDGNGASWFSVPSNSANTPDTGYGSLLAVRRDTTIKQFWFRNAADLFYTRSIEIDATTGEYASENYEWAALVAPTSLPVEYVDLHGSATTPIDLNSVASNYKNRLVSVYSEGAGSLQNAPVASHCITFQFQHVNNPNYLTQICFPVSSNTMYVRFCANGNWHDWVTNVSSDNLLAQATANLPNYYPSVSVSEGTTNELVAIKFSPGGSDDTFIFDLRGGERWLYAHGYNYQDVNTSWNNQLVRLSPGANKLLTASNVPLKYDNTTHTLYVTRAAYSSLTIQQISGTKQTITVTRSTTMTVPSTATVTVNVSYAGVCVCTTGVSGTTLDVASLVQAYGYGVYHIAVRGSSSVGSFTLYAMSTDQYSMTGSYSGQLYASANLLSTPINFASFNSNISSIQEVRKEA